MERLLACPKCGKTQGFETIEAVWCFYDLVIIGGERAELRLDLDMQDQDFIETQPGLDGKDFHCRNSECGAGFDWCEFEEIFLSEEER